MLIEVVALQPTHDYEGVVTIHFKELLTGEPGEVNSVCCGGFSQPQGNASDDPGQGWGRHPDQRAYGDGETVFRQACKLGLEGIVSKRKDSAYRSGRSPDWLKMKNSGAPAVKREEEEEWGKKKWR
jgi:hypothetical protein